MTQPTQIEATLPPSQESVVDPSAAAVPVVEIRPTRGWASLDLGRLWEYRELLGFMTWRDVKVRYKQTLLGATWAILQPVCTMVVFSLFFGKLAGLASDGVPYPIFAFAALVPWTFFANGMSQAANSVVGGANLVRKIYFPRLVIPISVVLASFVDFVLAFAVLVCLMLYYGITPTINIVWLPAFTLLACITSLGVGLWLSAMNVKYRDVRYIVPFLSQLWMFATPIAYSSKLLNEPWSTIYGLNPMVGVVDGFRWALLGTSTAPGPGIWLSVGAALLLLTSGAYYFRRMERSFADLV